MKIEELKEFRGKHPKDQRAADKNVDRIRPHLVTYEKNKPFVFISYKSDDWYVVLHEIVFILVHDYGLNVYYDGSFDDHLPNWIEQFPPNMASNKCRAVLTFRSDRYDCSYATLMEVMYSQGTMCEKRYDGKNKKIAMTLLPINLTQSIEVTGEEAEQDTGLGVEIYADGSRNEHYKKELELFNGSFRELTERGIIIDGKYRYKPDSSIPAERILTYERCSDIMRELFAGKANDNPYLLGEAERSKFFANLTTMLRDIDPRVFDSDRARLKPGEYYVPESGTTAKEREDRPVTVAPQPSPTTSDVTLDDTIPDFPVSVNDKTLHSGSAGKSDSRKGAVPESGTRRITGRGYDASFTYTAVINSKNETEYRVTLLKGSKVNLDSHIKTGWQYEKKHRSDIDETSGILKNDIPDLATSTAECIVKGNSYSGKTIRHLIENAAVSAEEGSDPAGKEPEIILSQEDVTEVPTDEAPVSAAQKIGGVCRITGSDYDASFIYTAVINAKNETDYRITLLKGSKVKLASHIKTGWKYDKKHRSDIDETSGILKNDIPDLPTSAAECIIKGNSCSGKAIRTLIGEAESKVI